MDKHGRLHYVTPHTGPVHVVNRASKFQSATSTAHVSDLSRLFREVPAVQKKVVSLLVDGGPDFSPKHVVNLLTYGRLWKDHCLDALVITCHASGQSAHNSIEHAWSLLSKSLASITLPITLRVSYHQNSSMIPRGRKQLYLTRLWTSCVATGRISPLTVILLYLLPCHALTQWSVTRTTTI